MAKGDFVSDALVTPMMLSQIKSLGHSWMLVRTAVLTQDGFPRTKEQAVALDKELASHGTKIDFVLNLDVPWSSMPWLLTVAILNRIEERWIHAPSGRTYNVSFNPPKIPGKDDVTGEPLTKRPDDDVTTFRHRLEKYHEATEPLIAYYRSQGVLFNFRGMTSDSITPQIFEVLHKLHL
ncbi:hypothetical protein HDU91_002705 [Kappamyces sp. JEL0680]|nr:hypothetical protein HDU91_002705 [Kappamyces sp. JEL0680]